jgi:virulence-associated protein VagC
MESSLIRRNASMVVAPVIKIGGSQAIRLPKEFRVESERVYLKCTT